MTRLFQFLQWTAGFGLGLLPVASARLAAVGASQSAVSVAMASTFLPAVASLYAWDRHPHLVGGIISGIVVVGGPLNPMLVACGPLVGW
jgi:hypothetical protein